MLDQGDHHDLLDAHTIPHLKGVELVRVVLVHLGLITVNEVLHGDGTRYRILKVCVDLSLTFLPLPADGSYFSGRTGVPLVHRFFGDVAADEAKLQVLVLVGDDLESDSGTGSVLLRPLFAEVSHGVKLVLLD